MTFISCDEDLRKAVETLVGDRGILGETTSIRWFDPPGVVNARPEQRVRGWVRDTTYRLNPENARKIVEYCHANKEPIPAAVTEYLSNRDD